MIMEKFKIIKATSNYTYSFWNAFNEIVKEKKFLSISMSVPYDTILRFSLKSIKDEVPYNFLLNNNKVIGWCDIQKKSKDIGILAMGIIANYRQKGLGENLLNKTLIDGKKYGFSKIIIKVREKNTNALKFYKKQGFEVIEIEKKAFFSRGNYEDLIKMSIEI